MVNPDIQRSKTARRETLKDVEVYKKRKCSKPKKDVGPISREREARKERGYGRMRSSEEGELAQGVAGQDVVDGRHDDLL